MRSFEFAQKNGKNMYENAQLPEYQTEHSAGADFFAAEDTAIPSLIATLWSNLIHHLTNGGELNPLAPTLIHTGVKADMGDDEVLELYNRSSNPKKIGLVLANGVGVVDKDYYGNPDNDGEIMFAFYNFFPFAVTIKKGDRIGQGVFKKFLKPTKGLRIKNDKRQGGFGSTSK